MHERTQRGTDRPALPNRFPGVAGQRVLRLADELQLISGLNKTTSKNAGLYIELKSPSFHKKEFGTSMGEALMKLLATHEVHDRCFIQCFELDELRDLHDRLHCKLPLIALLGRRPADGDMENIAKYAKGLGPSLELLATRNASNEIESTGLVEAARKAGLNVHPYTVRKHHQPRWSSSLEETHRVLLKQLKVDGFFTDYPDLGRAAVDSMTTSPR
jgi:glycerophosphoryl diester phosphodiesterase